MCLVQFLCWWLFSVSFLSVLFYDICQQCSTICDSDSFLWLILERLKVARKFAPSEAGIVLWVSVIWFDIGCSFWFTWMFSVFYFHTLYIYILFYSAGVVTQSCKVSINKHYRHFSRDLIWFWQFCWPSGSLAVWRNCNKQPILYIQYIMEM